MGFAIAAFTISLFIQLAVCKIKSKATAKLVPLFIGITCFACLIIPSLTPLKESFDTVTLIMTFFAFVVLAGIAGIGFAWMIVAVKYALHKKN